MKAVKRTRRNYSSHHCRRYAYPNAAEPRYFQEKMLDGITALLTGMGTVTLFFYLIFMF